MIQMQIALSDKHYQYLQQRAQSQGASLDQIVSELIEADLAWQQKLANDPMRLLIGQIDDPFNTKDIDKIVYGL
jgi:hypothetical protein